jgi:PAS domain S-box-containing protein
MVDAGSQQEPWCSDPARLLESLGHAVIATDLTGNVQFWNPAAEQLYGWTAGEALGQSIAELTVPEVSQHLASHIMQVLRAGRQWSGGFTVRRKDGSTFPALVTDAGIHDDKGDLVGIVGVSTDLGHALRPLLARSSDAVVVLTPTAAISYLSPVAARLFGWTEQRVLGVPLWELVHPDDRQTATEYHRQVSSPAGAAAPLECRLRRNGDSWCWAEVVMTDLLEDPAVRGVVCNLRDVTERRRDRDQLAEVTEHLRTALTTRVVIEQAKGIVAATRGIGVEDAFQILRKHARDHNARLHDVATAVVTLGLRP